MFLDGVVGCKLSVVVVVLTVVVFVVVVCVVSVGIVVEFSGWIVAEGSFAVLVFTLDSLLVMSDVGCEERGRGFGRKWRL